MLTMDDKHEEVDGGVVSEEEHGRYPRAASLDKIVDFCAEEFACANVRNSAFSTERFLSNCVFMVHKWFLSSEELLTKFKQRYLEHSASKNENQKKYKASICAAVGFWISKYGLEFKKDVKLVSLLNQFSEIVDCKGDKSVIDNSNIMAEVFRNRTLSVPAENEQTEPSMERKNSMAFKDISASTLAEQLTYLEYKMLRRVPFSELWTYVSTGKLKETTYLERYVALFNGVSRWLQGMVLNCVTPEERASCIEKFQQTAKHLKELQNFNGLMAVAGGLTSSPLSRLHQTQDLLSHDCKEFLKILMEFLSSDGNYAMYRKALGDATGFLIPILGIQLKDLIALHTALPDSVEGNLINVQKMIRLATIVAPLLQVHTSQPPVNPNLELIKVLRVTLQTRLTDEELYELSLAREPRSHSPSMSSSLSSDHSVMFADWAAGLLQHTTSDPQTSERHVSSMVEAVFKIYDTNKDGSISGEEFDAIATNFPFIDSFGVLDVNSDGVISREEMRNYFMKANCQELTKGFSHNFQEFTYFTPTFCDHCGGMLWGIIKQGYRCKDCHINCHKNCKAEVVIGCRRKQPENGSDKTLQKSEMVRSKGKYKSLKRFHKHHSEETLKAVNGESINVPLDQYRRLVKAQECNEALLLENERLHSELKEATQKLSVLQNQVNAMKQNTVTFILEQMDTLKMQKVTEV